MEQNNLVVIDFSMIIQMINFLILVYVFYKLFSKKIGNVIEERRNLAKKGLEEVEVKLQEVELEKEKMEKLRLESKKRANDIIIKAEIQAENRKEQILHNAAQSKERLMANAEKEIVKSKAKAELELQKNISSIAVSMAEKLLKENISENSELKGKSVDSFINELGE